MCKNVSLIKCDRIHFFVGTNITLHELLSGLARTCDRSCVCLFCATAERETGTGGEKERRKGKEEKDEKKQQKTYLDFACCIVLFQRSPCQIGHHAQCCIGRLKLCHFGEQLPVGESEISVRYCGYVCFLWWWWIRWCLCWAGGMYRRPKLCPHRILVGNPNCNLGRLLLLCDHLLEVVHIVRRALVSHPRASLQSVQRWQRAHAVCGGAVVCTCTQRLFLKTRYMRLTSAGEREIYILMYLISKSFKSPRFISCCI